MLFEVKEVDRCFYQQRIKDFIPDKVIDIHTHLWSATEKTVGKKWQVERVVSWPGLVAKDNPAEDLMETYKLMFPDKDISTLVFANPLCADDLDGENAYVSDRAKEFNLPSLILSTPLWGANELEIKILAGSFLGAKVYLSFADLSIPRGQITIFDFLPRHQLEVLNEHGWIVMLHIPRDGRLKDPVNLSQMLEIEKRYPDIKLIIAHVGRAYCIEDVSNAFEVLADTENIVFDFSANTNAEVFEQLIKAVGPKRILFGSDLPITRMRMRRICNDGIYVNIVPKGLYGDVSGDKNMCEVEGEEAEKLTFFLYEEIYAFRRSAENCGLTSEHIEDVFYNNAVSIIESAKAEKS